MSQETRPLWGVILGIVIILVVGVLFVYGQRQRMAEERERQEQATQEPAEEEKEPLVIGGIVPLSGEEALRGVAIQKAALIALKEVNDADGIAGRPIEIIWKDDKCSGSAAITAAQELVTINNAGYILGGICNIAAKSIAPIAAQHKAVVISPSATDPELTKFGGQYFFRTAVSDALIGNVAARHALNNLQAKKAAVIFGQDRLSQQRKEVFSQTLKKLGGEIVFEQLSLEYTREENEITPLSEKEAKTLAKGIEEAEAQVVYIVNENTESEASLIQALRDKKIDAAIIATEATLIAELAPLETPEETEPEKNAVAAALEDVLTFKPQIETSPAFIQFLKTYKQQTGTDAPFAQEMANMYSQIYLLKQAIENVDDNATKVRNYISRARNWEHALGKLTFDENGDRLVKFGVWRVESGKLKEVGVVDTSK